MIDSHQPKQPDQPKLELIASIGGIKTQKIDWATKVAYDIAFRTLDKNALILGAFKARQIVKITVEPINGAEEANKEREFK